MYIAHRINTLEELKNTEAIEFDVRDSNGICIVQHDPFKEGIPLDIFLNEFLLTRVKGQGQGQGQFLIVNIKSEGIEVPPKTSLTNSKPWPRSRGSTRR